MRTTKRRAIKISIYALLIVYAGCNVYPLLWMLMNSFKSEKEISMDPLAFPKVFQWNNYLMAWKTARFESYFANSFFVGVTSVLITVFLGALASYFLSRFKFKMSGAIYGFFLFGMLIPVHATLVPIFILMKTLGILNTHLSLILPYIAFNLPITLFILHSFMKTFPLDIEESATMDGCGIFRIFWSVILPMTRPAIATVMILNFINNWNEFSFALVLINSTSLKTLPLGLANFAGQYTTNYGAQMAGLTLALLPTLTLYLFMEQYLVKGMTAGAVKG